MQHEAQRKLTSGRLILAAGLAFVFLWFGIDKLARPLYWIGWIPLWMAGFAGLSRDVWLQVAGVLEIGIGVGIIVPVLRLHFIRPTPTSEAKSLPSHVPQPALLAGRPRGLASCSHLILRCVVLLAILHLLAVLTQTGFSDVGIRDIGLLFAATALFLQI